MQQLKTEAVFFCGA